MSKERKLTDMVDYFRGKLSEEQLRCADAVSTVQALQRELDDKNARITELEQELEGYRVSTKDTVAPTQD